MERNQGFCSWLTCRFLCPLLLLDLAQQVCWTLEKWFEFELSKTWKLDYGVFVFLTFNRRIHWWLEWTSGTIHGRVANLRQSSWTNVLTVTISSGPHFECEFHFQTWQWFGILNWCDCVVWWDSIRNRSWFSWSMKCLYYFCLYKKWSINFEVTHVCAGQNA